jgi:hypothetical protein
MWQWLWLLMWLWLWRWLGGSEREAGLGIETGDEGFGSGAVFVHFLEKKKIDWVCCGKSGSGNWQWLLTVAVGGGSWQLAVAVSCVFFFFFLNN